MLKEYLRESLSRFGTVDCVDMLPAKKIAFVHFASITAAITCKEALQADAQWKDFRLSYGKDRCAAEAKGRPHGDALNGRRPAVYPPAPAAPFPPGYPTISGYLPATQVIPTTAYAPPHVPHHVPHHAPHYATPYAPPFTAAAGAPSFTGERTIYLGGVTEDVNLKDVFDNISGGMIDQVKVIPEKKCCFVSFVDPQAAHNFMTTVQHTGFTVGDKHFKVGWGKSKPLPPTLLEALRTGATRNVFLGNVDADVTPEKLLNDFSKPGRVLEKIDVLPAKKLAFLHFTSIQNAMEAVEELRTEGNPLREAYSTCRVNFGRDRCATERINRAMRTPPLAGPMASGREAFIAPPQVYQPDPQSGYPPFY